VQTVSHATISTRRGRTACRRPHVTGAGDRPALEPACARPLSSRALGVGAHGDPFVSASVFTHGCCRAIGPSVIAASMERDRRPVHPFSSSYSRSATDISRANRVPAAVRPGPTWQATLRSVPATGRHTRLPSSDPTSRSACHRLPPGSQPSVAPRSDRQTCSAPRSRPDSTLSAVCRRLRSHPFPTTLTSTTAVSRSDALWRRSTGHTRVIIRPEDGTTDGSTRGGGRRRCPPTR
jgi:hypothetical protein